MSGVPEWPEERAERIAEELTEEPGPRERGPRFEGTALTRAEVDDDLELCFHPEVDRGWSFDPADPFVTAYWARCRDPRCTVEQFSIHGFPTLPDPWAIKK